MNEFIKGMDISTLYELESLGAKFYDNDKEEDLLKILKTYDVNYIRLRLWNDPFNEEKKPYGAGTNDLTMTIKLAKRVIEHGYSFLLDYHYSDFWADPGKQFKPKAWSNYNDEQLEEVVYQFTKESLEILKRENVLPHMVQVGNELSNGLLWPNGKWPKLDNIARFVKAGVRAVRSVDPSIKVMIHLDNGGNNKLYQEWFDSFTSHSNDFDVIGLSYYPFWHGTLDDLERNMNDLAMRYQKDLIVAEVAMGYTTNDNIISRSSENEVKESKEMTELAEKEKSQRGKGKRYRSLKP